MNIDKIGTKLAEALKVDTGSERYLVEVSTTTAADLDALVAVDPQAISLNIEVHGAEYFKMNLTKAQIEGLTQLPYVTLVELVGTRILNGRLLSERIERDRFFRSLQTKS